MKSIFITGGAGFLGRHLCRRLLSSGFSLVVYDNFSNSSESSFNDEFGAEKFLQYIKADITNQNTLTQAMIEAKPQAVVHLAAIVSVQESIQNPDLTYRVNAGGSENVTFAMKNANIQKLIFTSSAAVYGKSLPPLFEEMARHDQADHLDMLLSPYAKSKLMAEKIILQSGINSTIFRIFNIYGKNQNTTGAYPSVIPAFIESLKKMNKVIIYGDGLQSRDFISVEDVVISIQKALETAHVGGVFNLATGKEVLLTEVVSILENLYAQKIDIDYQPERSGDIKTSFADIDSIKKAFEFKPLKNLKDGLQDLLLAS